MIPGRPAHLSVFAVGHDSVQVVWRHLRPGELVFEGSPGGRVELELGPERSDPHSGAVVLDRLQPGTAVEIVVTGSAVDGRRRLTATTLPAPRGPISTSLATVSDLHLGARAFGHRGTIVEEPEPEVAHPIRCSRAAVAEAVAWGASTMVAKGDLTNHGLLDEWRHYADLVSRAPVPVLGIPGNHDRAFAAGSSGLSPEDAGRVFGLRMASPLLVVDRPGARLVLVDSTSGRRNRGSIAGTIDDAIQAVAETERGSVALVLMHHQLHQHPVHEVWPIGIDRRVTVRFLDGLAATGTPTLVSGGHTHRHRRWVHRGVVVTQVGSTKDYPGVWAGYTVGERSVTQVVRRVSVPDCIRWTDHTRRAAWGAWRFVSPGTLSTRCFTHTW